MMSAADRFWDKVELIPEHACWEWTASKNENGYGKFSVGGKVVRAHRFSYELEHGPIPDGLLACHKCDNPGCVNPNHIFLGTQTDNMADKEKKGRGNQPRGDRNGSRLHPEAHRGERNGRAKLTPDQVAEIRATYATGGVAYTELGRRFGVGKTAIGDVVRGDHWKGV